MSYLIEWGEVREWSQSVTIRQCRGKRVTRFYTRTLEKVALCCTILDDRQ